MIHVSMRDLKDDILVLKDVTLDLDFLVQEAEKLTELPSLRKNMDERIVILKKGEESAM